jgi:hypothetical protein
LARFHLSGGLTGWAAATAVADDEHVKTPPILL